jgi:hypothetical protein
MFLRVGAAYLAQQGRGVDRIEPAQFRMLLEQLAVALFELFHGRMVALLGTCSARDQSAGVKSWRNFSSGRSSKTQSGSSS